MQNELPQTHSLNCKQEYPMPWIERLQINNNLYCNIVHLLLIKKCQIILPRLHLRSTLMPQRGVQMSLMCQGKSLNQQEMFQLVNFYR